MMNIKKYLPRALSAAMSLVILCAGVGTAAFTAGAESAGTGTAAQESDTKKPEGTTASAKKAARSGVRKITLCKKALM